VNQRVTFGAPALEAMADAMPDAIIGVTSDGRIAVVNAQAEQLFGYSRSALLGQMIEILVPGDTRLAHPGHRETFFNRPQTRAMGAGMELAALRSDGVAFPAEISLSALQTNEGTLVCAAVRDVTEQRRAKEEIVQLNQQLQALNADLGRRVVELQATNAELETFSYSVSHDLRAPLRAINGFTTIILDEHDALLPDDAKQSLLRVQRNAHHLSQLIDALLMFSRMHRQPLNLEPIDVEPLVIQVWEDLMLEHVDRDVELVLIDPADCEGDQRLLAQVWHNLLGNALKYSRPRDKARVEISTERSDTEITYQVQDNGVGFDGRYAGKLFQIFQRFHPDAEFEGTGIGLALTARIIRRHGGRIWANGVPGEGATFTFTIPVHPPSSAPPDGTAGPEAEGSPR